MTAPRFFLQFPKIKIDKIPEDKKHPDSPCPTTRKKVDDTNEKVEKFIEKEQVSERSITRKP